MIKVGDMISELRKDRNLNQKDLAKICNVSIATISHYESGTNFPDIKMVTFLADFFGVSIDYLVGRTRFKMDWDTFKKKVKLANGTDTSVDEAFSEFIALSEESKSEILNLMNLFKLRDDIRNSKIKLSL